MDIIYYSDNYPKKNEKSTVTQYSIFTGGPAANAAITNSILGGESTVLTSIGKSVLGDAIKKDLRSFGVKVLDLSEGIDIQPFISAIMVNPDDGSRSIWSGQRSFNDITEPDYESLKEFDYCLCDCYMHPHSAKILERISKTGMEVVLDVDYYSSTIWDYLPRSTFVFFSKQVESESQGSIEGYCKDSISIRGLAVSNDSNPIKWTDFKNRTEGVLEIPPCKSIDTLGAGDILHGAFCHYFYEKELSFRDSLKKASEVASMSTTEFGTRKGVQNFISQFP